jgi:F0F1-type ATP synthase membrane subunit b/b'
LDGAIRKSEKEINDRIRKRVEADIETTRRSVQEGINQHHNDIQKSVAENSERLSGADRGSKQYHTEAEPNIKRIRESKQEYKDTLRRQSGDSLNEASRGLEKPIERARSRVQQFGDKVREFGELVERVGEKIVVMAKKILSMLDGKKEKSKGNTRTLFKR